MKHFIKNKPLRRTIKTLSIIILSLIVLPFLLYIPPIQNLIKGIAIKEAQKATGYEISIDRLLLSFPLKLNIDNVVILDTQRDTIIASKHIDIDVKLLPLLNLNLAVNYANLIEAKYRFITSDSSMVLNVRIDKCTLDEASINMSKYIINLENANLTGGRVSIDFDNEKSKPSPKDTTKSTPWVINASIIKFKNVHYSMTMLPYIDNIDAQIASAILKDGYVNIGTREVKAKYLNIDNADAKYYTPTLEAIAKYIPPPSDTINMVDNEENTDWTVTGDSLSITNTKGLYALRNAKPKAGLDLDYLQGEKINIHVVNFFNRHANVRVPVAHFSGIERSGVAILSATGVFDMNETGMNIDNWDVKTNLSSIKANAFFGEGIFDRNPSSKVDIDINADLYLGEILTLYPSYSKFLKGIPHYSNTKARMNIAGNLNHLSLKEISANIPKYASFNISGDVTSLHTPKNIGGEIKIDGDFQNINFLKPSVLSAKLSKEIEFPPLKLHGNASLNGSNYTAQATMRIPTGKVAMNMKLNNRNESFAFECNLDSFPVQAIMPLGQVGRVTASATARGKGFDIFKVGTALNASLQIKSIEYNKDKYSDISATSTLQDGYLTVDLTSISPNCNFDIDLRSTIDNDRYNYSINTNIKDLNLARLGFSEVKSDGSLILSSVGDINVRDSIIDVKVDIQNINWVHDNINFITPSINVTLNSSANITKASLINQGLNMNIHAACTIDSLVSSLSRSSDAIIEQFKIKDIDFNKFVDILPHFTFDVNAKGDNLLNDYLDADNISFTNLGLNINKDSAINISSKILKLKFNTTTLDTILISANETNNTLSYNLHLGNKKGNMDAFAFSTLAGKINSNHISGLFTQQNSDNKTSFNLGIDAELNDSSTMVKFFPENPIIGFRNWALNSDNFLEYHYDKHIDANLLLKSDSSYFSIKTNHVSHNNREGIDIKIAKIEIGEWLNLSPFTPPINGELNSTMKLSYDGKNIAGNGNIGLSKFTYNKKTVGDFLLALNLAADPITGYTNAKTSLNINGHETLHATGVVNDSTSNTPFNLNLEITKFPLSIANPFIPQNLAKTSGYIDGEVIVTGSFSDPILDGYIQYDSTTINMPVFGSKLLLSNSKIKVDSSNIIFDNYNIIGSNNMPLALNGEVKIQSFTNPIINLTLTGRDVQFINSKRTSLSEVYGKGNMNINANLSGKLSNLSVNANIDILESTDLTYVMQTSVNSITESKASNIVHFVQFNDTTETKIKDFSEEDAFNMSINANVSIEPGAKFTVNISPEGKNKVEIVGSGNLTYTQGTLGNSRFTGQYYISKGFARYSPPLISEQIFNFESGSSVLWSGDIMNPILNIKANEVTKINVTPEGENSRVVNFDIQLSATNTLNNMDLSFDLSTNDDASIYSELQSMTPEQRSTQAMNIILYKKYIGLTAQADSKYFENPLYSFLAGQINNWASNNLRWVDLSFGISQYNRTLDGNTTLATNYSYQVSKSFLNNRFKVVVGGSYDTDYSTDQSLAQNLLNDVSIEYLITPSGSVYSKIFRHTGYANIFEGQITQTGAAIVLRRKLSTLKDIFKFNFKKDADIPPLDETKK